MRNFVIAIDGPAASGKSTTARLVARRLAYLHIDTGAMYRAMTLKVLRMGVDLKDRNAVEHEARRSSVRLVPGEKRNEVILDGENVTDLIREPEVTRAVSTVSSYPGVREVMVREQRSIASKGGVVLEGRDIGTVVLPDADLKCFLVADDRERARRRRKELAQSGVDVEEEDLLQELRHRDELDSSRAESPLRKADDAVEIDTTHLTIEQQVERILSEVERVRSRA
jgi:cytidylate kinase